MPRKEKKRTYVYKDGQLYGVYESVSEAARKTNEGTPQLRALAKAHNTSKRGFAYAFQPLSEDEIKQINPYRGYSANGKTKKPLYAYRNQEFIGKFESMILASKVLHDSTTSIRNVLKGLRDMTPQGYVYSERELSQAEMMETPISNRELKNPREGEMEREKYSCFKQVEDQVYEIGCSDGRVFSFKKKRSERVGQLREYIHKHLWTRWQTLPKNVSTLERQFVKELLKSLE